MSFLNKLAFWKKDDDFNFDALAEKEISRGHQGGALSEADMNLSTGSATEFGDTDSGIPSSSSGLNFGQQKDPLTSASIYPSSRAPVAPGSHLETRDRELELISSKLDTVKVLLSSLDQRVANIEKAAGVEQKQRLW